MYHNPTSIPGLPDLVDLPVLEDGALPETIYQISEYFELDLWQEPNDDTKKLIEVDVVSRDRTRLLVKGLGLSSVFTEESRGIRTYKLKWLVALPPNDYTLKVLVKGQRTKYVMFNVERSPTRLPSELCEEVTRDNSVLTAEIRVAIGQVREDVAVETLRATTAESALSDSLTDETAAREAAVTSLRASLDAFEALLSSDDVSLDQLQEIVNYIKDNRTSLDALGIGSVIGLSAALLELTEAVETEANRASAAEADILAGIGTSAAQNHTASDTPPANSRNGDTWLKTDTMQEFFREQGVWIENNGAHVSPQAVQRALLTGSYEMGGNLRIPNAGLTSFSRHDALTRRSSLWARFFNEIDFMTMPWSTRLASPNTAGSSVAKSSDSFYIFATATGNNTLAGSATGCSATGFGVDTSNYTGRGIFGNSTINNWAGGTFVDPVALTCFLRTVSGCHDFTSDIIGINFGTHLPADNTLGSVFHNIANASYVGFTLEPTVGGLQLIMRCRANNVQQTVPSGFVVPTSPAHIGRFIIYCVNGTVEYYRDDVLVGSLTGFATGEVSSAIYAMVHTSNILPRNSGAGCVFYAGHIKAFFE